MNINSIPTSMKAVIAIVILSTSLDSAAQQFSTLEKAFEVPEHDLIPEGIAYDNETDVFYIGSLYKNKIIQINSQGKASDFIGADESGDWSYLGMKVKDGKLWVCRSPLNVKHDSAGYGGLFIYDLKSGSLLKKHVTSEAGHLFNDLTFHGEDVYISDSEGGAVYKLNASTDSLEKFITPGSLVYPNGITLAPDGESLVVATSRGLLKVNLASKEVSPLPQPGYYIVGIDGLYTYKGTLIGFQNIMKPEAINQFILNDEMDEVEAVKTLTCGHPSFFQPTTGAIKNGWLYFIANSYVTVMDDNKALTTPATLKNLEIYRVKLE